MMHYPKRSTKAERAYVRAANNLDRAFVEMFASLAALEFESKKKKKKR